MTFCGPLSSPPHAPVPALDGVPFRSFRSFRSARSLACQFWSAKRAAPTQHLIDVPAGRGFGRPRAASGSFAVRCALACGFPEGPVVARPEVWKQMRRTRCARHAERRPRLPPKTAPSAGRPARDLGPDVAGRRMCELSPSLVWRACVCAGGRPIGPSTDARVGGATASRRPDDYARHMRAGSRACALANRKNVAQQRQLKLKPATGTAPPLLAPRGPRGPSGGRARR